MVVVSSLAVPFQRLIQLVVSRSPKSASVMFVLSALSVREMTMPVSSWNAREVRT